MTDPIQHLRDLLANLDRWDGIAMTGDMVQEYDAEEEEYREAVDRAMPALLAVAEAARRMMDPGKQEFVASVRDRLTVNPTIRQSDWGGAYRRPRQAGRGEAMNKQDTPSSPATLNRVVGQLRELLSKVPPGRWGAQHNNYGIGVLIRQPDDFVNVCWWDCEGTYEHTEDCRDLIIAAINALPAFLDLADMARALIRGGYLDDEINAANPLALELLDRVGDDRLPNRKADPAAVVGGSASSALLGADGQPEVKP